MSSKVSIPVSIPNTQEAWITVEKRADGWYACTSGTSRDGLYFESEDNGPWKTKTAAMGAEQDRLDDVARDEPTT